jgi:hypothetical protein
MRARGREEAAKAQAVKRAFGGLFGDAPPPAAQPAAALARPPSLPQEDQPHEAGGAMQRLGAWWRGSS